MADFEQTREFLFGIFEEQEGKLLYRYDAEKIIIEPWGENSLRVRGTKLAEMSKEDWALTEKVSSKGQVKIQKYDAEIINGKIRAHVNQIGKISFYNQKGELLLEEYVRNRKDMYGDTASSLEVEGRGTPVMRPLFYEFPIDTACWNNENQYMFGPKEPIQVVKLF